ncbi:MAG: MFS transporter [Oscillospiraceae bacterium]|nr:MFS transporter [Oscillospiraceae bacterium]
MALTQSQRSALRHPVKWLFNPEPEQEGEIPRGELTNYTVGLMGQNMLYGMAGGKFFHFCTNVMMIDNITVGKMMGAVTLFDALNDPVAGALIDNYRFKDGRKLLPWMKLTSPPIALAAFLMFVNWGLPTQGLRVLYCIAAYVIWDILYSFQDAALWGITAAIHPASAQRARATQFADIGAMLGGFPPALLLPMISGEGAFGLGQQQVYMIFAAVLCLGGGFLAMTSLRTVERVRSLPGEEKSVWKNIGALRHNYIVLLFLAYEVLNKVCPIVTDTYVYQQLSYQVGSKTVNAGAVVLILEAITGIPGASLKFFAGKVAERVGGMKRLLVIGRVTEIIVRLLQYLVGINTLPGLILVFVLNGIKELPNNITNIAQRTMISDSVEYVEWKTGERTEGITMSVRNLMSKMSGAVEKFIQGYVLDFLQFDARLVEQNKPQNAHFKKWIWPTYILGPVIGLMISLVPILLLNYPDSLKARVESEMAERRALAAHAAGEAAVQEAVGP